MINILCLSYLSTIFGTFYFVIIDTMHIEVGDSGFSAKEPSGTWSFLHRGQLWQVTSLQVVVILRMEYFRVLCCPSQMGGKYFSLP